MIAGMETIEAQPDPRDAASGLDAVADAQRAVRSRPWPLWLYPSNALLLGALALAGIIDSSMIAALVVVALGGTFSALNYWAGRRMGTPFAIPASRAFRSLVAVSAVFVILSLFTREAGLEWATVPCAAGATLSYGLGSVVHYRSTRR